MAITVPRSHEPVTATLATTCALLTVTATDCRYVELSCASDIYIVRDALLADAGALPAAYHRIPANTMWTLPLGTAPGDSGGRWLIAAASGTPTLTLFGWRE